MENIDKIFRERLKGAKQSAPAEIWDNIEAELDRTGSTKSLVVWRIAASITVLAGLSALLLWQFVPDNSINKLAEDVQLEEGIRLNAPSGEISEIPDQNPELSDLENSEEAAAQMDNALAINSNEEPTSYQSRKVIDAVPIEKKVVERERSLPSMKPYQPQLEVNVNNLKHQIAQNTINQSDTKIPSDDVIEEKQSLKDLMRKIEVGGNFSPTFAYRDVNSSGDGLPTELYNEYESGIMAFSGGLSLAMEVTKRLKVYSGLNYSQYGQQISGLNLYSNAAIDAYPEIYSDFSNSYQLNNSFGLADIQSAYFFTDETKYRVDVASGNKLFFDEENENFYSVDGVLQQKLAYLEVPFVLDYMLLDKGLQLSVQAGVGANFLVSDQLLLKTDKATEDIGNLQDLARNNFSGILGLRLSYPVSQAFDISLQPGLKYFINEINPASSVQTHPYTMGLYAGINYRF